MSKRRTPYWTRTTAQAYGPSGVKGRSGESFFIKVFKAKGWKVIDHESGRSKQCSGVDVTLKKKDVVLTIDVKTNLKENKSFAVEVQPDGWLYNTEKTSECICHVDPISRIYAIYPRKHMQLYIAEKRYYETNRKFIYLDKEETEKLSFIKWYSV